MMLLICCEIVFASDIRTDEIKVITTPGFKLGKRSYVYILGDPGATSREEAIFSGESFLQELKSPWELILTEPVPEVVEFRPSDWPEKYFSAQSARMSTQVTLSPCDTKWFYSLIDLLGPYSGKMFVESFKNKEGFNKARRNHKL